MKITYPITEHGIKAQKQVLCMNLLANVLHCGLMVKCELNFSDSDN